MKTRNPVQPFFCESLNDFVIDAMCECGHLCSEHGSLVLKVGLKTIVRAGHEGNCCSGSCGCDHFTWSRWVTVDEAADLKISQRQAVQAA